MPAIEFRHVSFSFDSQPVLVDISFKLEQGEMIFLTGVSGSGKSVLLRLAMGLIKPDAGQIFIEAGDEIFFRGFGFCHGMVSYRESGSKRANGIGRG